MDSLNRARHLLVVRNRGRQSDVSSSVETVDVTLPRAVLLRAAPPLLKEHATGDIECCREKNRLTELILDGVSNCESFCPRWRRSSWNSHRILDASLENSRRQH